MSDAFPPEVIAEAELHYARVKIGIDDLIGHTAVLRERVPEAAMPFATDDSIQEWTMALGQEDGIMLILGLISYIFDMTSPEQHALWAKEHQCSDERDSDDSGRPGSDN